MSARLREPFNRPGPKRILALDGGGARGLLTLGVLAQLERHLAERSGQGDNFRLAHYFDLIGGTSTGAIIATTLALEWRVRDVVDLYFKLLPAIFARPQVPGPLRPRVYKTKSKNAQEAHEAIRPTSANVIPDTIKSFLTPEQFKLYNLIWKRTVASQMESATLDTVAVDLQCGENHLFRANGSVVVDPGFMKVYEESLDDTKKEPDQKILPAMQQGDSSLANILLVNNILQSRHQDFQKRL